jgi:putative transposase
LVGPDAQVSVRHQCDLLDLCRSSYYYQPCPETPENLALMRRLDELHLDHPVYGSRKLRVLLGREGWEVNRDLEITGPDQAWCADITYVPMAQGFLYLVAVMDWWSRYVLAWRLSNTLESAFCVEAWEAALQSGRQAPLIANTDQGSQFTSPLYIDAVESAGVDVSMDGRGRWMDNRFIERLWRSVKHEDIYLQDYLDGIEAGRGLARWFEDYNRLRPHAALHYATPAAVYSDPGAYGAQPARWEAMQRPGTRQARKT